MEFANLEVFPFLHLDRLQGSNCARNHDLDHPLPPLGWHYSTPRKWKNVEPEDRDPFLKEMNHLRTINFQGSHVSFQGGGIMFRLADPKINLHLPLASWEGMETQITNHNIRCRVLSTLYIGLHWSFRRFSWEVFGDQNFETNAISPFQVKTMEKWTWLRFQMSSGFSVPFPKWNKVN